MKKLKRNTEHLRMFKIFIIVFRVCHVGAEILTVDRLLRSKEREIQGRRGNYQINSRIV